ncbi:MAG: HTTM domain-containing protein [Candidatus Peregrinibacteria bacterium Greene0416_19]|nr:MAG: HTTM domain-containing protein [Candidatus Peregrinibacteria bacterium Greene0416_19]
MILPLLHAIWHFFHRRMTATGFGLMRIGWGLTVFLFMLGEWQDVTRYYSAAGFVPPHLEPVVLRTFDHWTLLDTITDPQAVFMTYLLLLAACLCMIVGFLPRLSTIVAVLLIFSFHERNFLPLGGGETVMRLLGFLLMIAPGTTAFSLHRLRKQWRQFRASGKLLAPKTMPAWPYLLLVWQFIVLYTMSGWDKVLGTMWVRGTAVASALHHPQFARFPPWFMDQVSVATVPISLATIVWEFSWLLLLLPARWKRALLRGYAPWIKRIIIAGGLLFHGAIFLLMDAGSFSMMLFTGYLGLLTDEDIRDLRGFLNRGVRGPVRRSAGREGGKIVVLFDGICGLCRRSIFAVMMMDWLHRIVPADFRSAAIRKKYVPDITEKTLDRSMHVRFLPKRKQAISEARTLAGFDGFRALTWRLPPLWPVAPLLYLPGITWIGRRTYARIAQRRNRCRHGEECRM